MISDFSGIIFDLIYLNSNSKIFCKRPLIIVDSSMEFKHINTKPEQFNLLNKYAVVSDSYDSLSNSLRLSS
jgi:hypothetical protein